MNGPIYLICSYKGYYITFSQMDAEDKCKYLLSQTDKNLKFYTEKELVDYLLDYIKTYPMTGIKFVRKDIVLGRVVLWSAYRCIIRMDLKKGMHHYIWPNGEIVVKEISSGRCVGRYRNCQTGKVTDAKTVKWVEKQGYAYGYNFEQQQDFRYTVDDLPKKKRSG